MISGLVEAGQYPGADVGALAARGFRVLAVASGQDGTLRVVGLVALQDPPRTDAAGVIEGLRGLGVRVLTVTGDGPETAQAIAARVGIGTRVGSP